jgi:hydrogenase expression/formation protein HypE
MRGLVWRIIYIKIMNNKKSILLGHGSGGKMSDALIKDLFLKHFADGHSLKQYDSAILNPGAGKIAFTTDSFVVDPIFFPGGNIGNLAVSGTVNDLAVSGAKPAYLSASFIIEEGFSLVDLERVVHAMALEAKKANVLIVAGDTKVVNRGKCDKLFITTSGIGWLADNYEGISSAKDVKPGDLVIINGSVAEHGMAVLSAREKLEVGDAINSDVAPLNRMIQKVLDEGIEVKFMRDATRGGIATVLKELAELCNYSITIDEDKIPVCENVRGLCEMLGFDPLYVANEGKVIMVVRAEDSKKCIQLLKATQEGKSSAIIGIITDDQRHMVVLNTVIGGKRILDKLSGEQLPRIC